MKRMSHYQKAYVEYISKHPGCSKADVDRACRVNPMAGHCHVYDGVTRLVRRGIIIQQKGEGNRCALYVAD